MKKEIRVGILNDMCDGPPGVGDISNWLKRAVDSVRASGRLTADVEYVHSYGLGLPAGTAEAVIRAYEELAGQDVLLITGPAVSQALRDRHTQIAGHFMVVTWSSGNGEMGSL